MFCPISGSIINVLCMTHASAAGAVGLATEERGRAGTRDVILVIVTGDPIIIP